MSTEASMQASILIIPHKPSKESWSRSNIVKYNDSHAKRDLERQGLFLCPALRLESGCVSENVSLVFTAAAALIDRAERR